MPTNYTPLTNGQFATAAVFNAPLTELDTAIENIVSGTKALTAPDINGGTIDGATGVFAALTSSAGTIAANGAVLTNRGILAKTSGVNRILFGAGADAETGSNAGSNGYITCYTDAGAFNINALAVDRATGNMTTGANFTVTGTLSKGGGTFLVDHPLDPDNRNLIHSFVEAPRADLIYRGRVTLANGQATVNIDTASNMTPGTFEALTKHTEADIFLQNINGWEVVRGTLVGGTLTIITQHQRPTDTDMIAWLVVAERNDAFYRASDLTDAQGNFIVEVDKPDPTPEELTLLQPVENDEMIETRQETVSALIGKRGYPIHAKLTGQGVIPQREVRPRPINATRVIIENPPVAPKKPARRNKGG